MGKGSSTNTVTENKTPWAPAAIPLTGIPSQALGVYNQANALPKPQPLGLTAPGADQLHSMIQGDYLNGNPYLDTILRKTAGDVNAQFEGAGRYGSGAWQDALGNAMGNLRYQNYAGERQNQIAAMMAAPTYDLAPYAQYQEAVKSLFDPLTTYQQSLLGVASAGQAGTMSQPMYQNYALQALGGLGALGSTALAAKNLGLLGGASAPFGATNLASLGVGSGLYDLAPGALAAAGGATGGIGAATAGAGLGAAELGGMSAGGKTLAEAAPIALAAF